MIQRDLTLSIRRTVHRLPLSLAILRTTVSIIGSENASSANRPLFPFRDVGVRLAEPGDPRGRPLVLAGARDGVLLGICGMLGGGATEGAEDDGEENCFWEAVGEADVLLGLKGDGFGRSAIEAPWL